MSPREMLFQISRMPGTFAVTALLWLAFSLVPILIGLLMRAVFDSLAADTDAARYIWLLLSALLAAEVTHAVLGWIWLHAHQTLQLSLVDAIKRDIFLGTMQSRDASLSRGATGGALDRINADADFYIMPVREVYQMLGEAACAVAALIIMMQIDWLITVAVVLPLVIIVLVVNAFGPWLEVTRESFRTASERANIFLSDVLGSVMSVKVAGAYGPTVTRFRELTNQRQVAALRDKLAGEVVHSFSWNFANIGRAVVLLLAASSIQRGTFSIGDLALFLTYLSWLVEFPKRVGESLTHFRLSKVARSRIDNVLPESQVQRKPAHDPIFSRTDCGSTSALMSERLPLKVLEVEGLSTRLPGTDFTLSNVNFSIHRGECVAIVGSIGAGKTALLEMLLGITPIDSGEIKWNGRRVDDPSSFMMPPQCAYIPQVPNLISETLESNIRLGADVTRNELKNAIAAAAFEEDLGYLDAGLKTIVGPRGTRLSGGQRVRVGVARALLRRPELLVVDDLSSALDTKTEWQVWNAIFAKGHMTKIVASNSSEVLKRADLILVLEGGRVTASGVLTKVLNESEVLQEIFEHQ